MLQEFTLLSSNGVYNIHGVRWIPETEIRGVVQITHGMCEYIERYEDFARFLNSKGLVVVGHDHIGHGRTVNSEENLGYFADKDGAGCTIKDMHSVTEFARALYPKAPYVILGHSMGSFITANYIEQYGNEIDAAILVGTGLNSSAACTAGRLINDIVARLKGERHRSRLVSRLMFGRYNSRIADCRSEYDWICSDEEILSEYLADSHCGYTFTTNGNRALISFMQYERRHFKDIPESLPVLLASGLDDPVSNYGKSVEQIADILRKNGVKDISVKLYENMRHEILNEKDKVRVYEDLYNWINDKIKLLQNGDI